MLSSLLDTLWPVKELLDYVFLKLLDKCFIKSINIESLEKEIKSKEFCEIENLQLNSSEINLKIFKFFPIQIATGYINKIYIKFPKNYFKEKIEIRLEDLNIVLQSKLDDHMIEKDYQHVENFKTKILPPILKIINSVLNNVEITLKNISVQFYHNMNTNSKCGKSHLKLLISRVKYDKFKDNPKDFLFLFNKQLTVDNFLVKICHEDIYKVKSDKDFFKLCGENKEKELIDFYTQTDCIMTMSSRSEVVNSNSLPNSTSKYNYCSFNLKIEKDKEKDNLLLTSNIDKFELILMKDQFNFLLHIFSFVNKLNKKLTEANSLLNIVNTTVNEFEKAKQKTFIEILHYKLYNINTTFNISNLNIVILENSFTQNVHKPKMWLMYESYYIKYYLSTDDGFNHTYSSSKSQAQAQVHSKDLYSFNSINNIQRHFCYFEDNFFIFNFSNCNFNYFSSLGNTENQHHLSFLIPEINSRYIEPNLIPIKKDLIIINNIITNDVEKYFDEKFSKTFLTNIKYGHKYFNILEALIVNGKYESIKNSDIRETNTNSCENNFNTLICTSHSQFLNLQVKDTNLDINVMILLKAFYLIGSINSEKCLEALPDQINIIKVENEKSSQESQNLSLVRPESYKDPIVTEGYLPRNSVRDLITNCEKRVKENSIISGNKKIITKNKIIEENEQKSFKSISKNLIQNETKIIVHFNLSIKITGFNNCDQLFKDFYHANIQNLFLSKNRNVSLDDNHLPWHILKIAENVRKDFITLKFNSSELIILKNFNSDNLNIYSDLNNFFIFYYFNDYYFPIVLYRNKSFIPSRDMDLDIQKIETLKEWLSIIYIKKSCKNENLKEYSNNQLKYYMNMHHVKDNQHIEDVSCEIQNKFINSEANSSSMISLNFDFLTIDILFNNIYLDSLIELIQNLQFSTKYILIILAALRSKYGISSNTGASYSYYSLDFKIKEINILGYSNLNLNLFENHNIIIPQINNEELTNNLLTDINLLAKYINTEENIFNIINNIFFKIHLNNFDFTFLRYFSIKSYLIFSLENFKILFRKNDNIYHDNKIKNQIFFQGIFEEENFDHFLYKGSLNKEGHRNIITILFNLDTRLESFSTSEFDFTDPTDLSDFIHKIHVLRNKNTKYEVEITTHIDDIVISPLFNNFEESIKLLEEIKKDYFKMKIIMKNDIQNLNLNSNINFSSNSDRDVEIGIVMNTIQSNVDLNVNFQISRLIIDTFSYYTKNSSNVELKHKMRLINEIEGLHIQQVKGFNNLKSEDITNKTFKLSISRINSLFLKNLDYKNTQNILKNKCRNISKENSIWCEIGFSEIFNLENLQITLSEHKNNYKSEFLINSIELLFCKDSFKYFLKFLEKSKHDYTYISNLINKYAEFDNESVITELEMIQDKLMREQVEFLSKNDSSIEYKKVNSSSRKRHSQSVDIKLPKRSLNIKPQAESYKDNNQSLYVLDNNDNCDRRSNSSSIKLRIKKKETFNSNSEINSENKLDDNRTDGSSDYNIRIGENNSKNEKDYASKIQEKINLFFSVNNFKIYLFEGKDFAFVDIYTPNDEDTITEENDLRSQNYQAVPSASSIYKHEKDFSVMINLNTNMLEVVDDYLNYSNSESLLNKENKEKGQIINVKSVKSRRLRLVQRNYSNYVMASIEEMECKFLYYINSPVIFSNLLEIKRFTFNDNIKDSNFKKIITPYNFEEENQFLIQKLDLIQSSKNEIEICAFLQLTPINILVDQFTLRFLIKFFKINLEEIGKENSNASQDVSYSVVVSQINTEHINNIQHDTLPLNTNNAELFSTIINKKNLNFSARRVFINEFFINFSYNAQVMLFDNLKDKKFLDCINISSIKDLKLEFKIFDFRGKKKLGDIFNDIYQYWKKDILKEQIINAYLSSISFIHPFKNIVKSFVGIFSCPYSSYQKNLSIQEGCTEGFKNFVITFSTEALTFGEKLNDFMKKVFRSKNNKRKSLYRKLVYIINEDKRKLDQYYLKN